MTKNRKETIASLKEEIGTLQEEIKHLKSRLSMSSSAFLNIVGKSLDGVVIIDEKKMVQYTNYAAISFFDRNIADLLGEPLELDLNPVMMGHNNETTTELHVPKANGTDAIAEVSVLKSEWNNEPCYVVSFRDITARKKTEELLEYMSTHDYLTNLPNRVLFEKEIDEAVQHSRDNAQHMALIYLDLDNFKQVNDTLGHVVGDQLLKEVSMRLQQTVRGGDTIARLGGDEFALILHSIRKPEYAAVVSRSILDKLGKVFQLEENEIFINASIGIAVYPYAGTSAVELIKNADTAMYIAKAHGKNQYQYYSVESTEQAEQDLIIINGLRNVIHNNELILQYQPIIDLNTSTCWGIEALLRWEHPQLGLVYPAQFLHHAEDSGIIVSIGQWVIQRALEDYKRLHLTSLLFISINISANELVASKMAETIYTCTQESGISACKLVVELTEASMMHHPNDSIKKFERLSKMGVQIAIDDYGTGYSSLSILKKLPISILKIDKSFMDDIDRNSNNQLIVKSTIQLAHNLGLKVIAECIETKKQFEFLKDHGCDYLQGYYYSKPLDIDELQTYIQNLI